MAIWLYHVNPQKGDYYYDWDLSKPRNLLRTSPWFVAGKMFRKVAADDLICIYMKNISPNPDGCYVVGKIVAVDTDEREFRWKPDRQLSAPTLDSPVPPEIVRKFFGRSYGHIMQQLPTRKTDQWLRLLGGGEGFRKPPRIQPKRSEESSPKQSSSGLADEIADLLESKRLAAQGFKTNAAMRRAIEQYAVNRSRRYYENHGFRVHEHGRPFDLKCQKRGSVLYVEVKGTQTSGGEIIVTRNEVDFAQRNKIDLFLLYSVNVVLRQKRYIASGGEEYVVSPWRPGAKELRPLAFSCSIRRVK